MRAQPFVSEVAPATWRDLTRPFDGKPKTHFYGPADGAEETATFEARGDLVVISGAEP